MERRGEGGSGGNLVVCGSEGKLGEISHERGEGQVRLITMLEDWTPTDDLDHRVLLIHESTPITIGMTITWAG